MGDVVAAPPFEDAASSVTDSVQHPSSSKELGQRTLRSLKRGFGKLWRRHRGNASITEYDPCYKVAYLGNVLTGWAKGQSRFKLYVHAAEYLCMHDLRSSSEDVAARNKWERKRRMINGAE